MASIETIGIEFDTSGLKQGQKALADTETAARKTTSALDGVSKETKEVGTSSSTAATLTKGFAAAISLAAVSAAALKAIHLADEYANINARLKLVSQGTEQFAAAQAALFQVAQQTRTSLSATVELYSTLARSTKELGLSQKQLLQITETFNKAVRLGGGSAQSAAAAITQFNQAMASGVFRGEEFNSVAEQAPRILDILSSSLGKTRGELRQMAEDGLLTAEVVLPALEKGAAAVNAEFSQLPVTVGQAMEMVTNATLAAVGAADQATSSTSALAQGLVEVAHMIEAFTIAMKDSGQESQVMKTLVDAAVLVIRALAVAVNTGAGQFVMFGKAIGAAAAIVGSIASGEFKQAIAIFDSAARDMARIGQETMARNQAIINSEKVVADQAKKTAADVAASGQTSAAASKQAEEAAKSRAKADMDAFIGASKSAKQQAEVAKLGAAYSKALAAAQGDPAKVREVTKAYQEQRAELEKGVGTSKKSAAARAAETAAKKAAREEAKALKEEEKRLNDMAKDYSREVERLNKIYADAAKSNKEMVDRAQEEYETYGKTKTEIQALNIAKQEELVIDTERAAVMAGMNKESEREIKLAKDKLDAMKKVLTIMEGTDQKDAIAKAAKEMEKANQDAAKKAADEWQKTSDSISDSLTDALMRGFEGGKDIAANFKETLMNMFKTLILQPTIKAIVAPVAGGITSLISGTANAGTGGMFGGGGGFDLSSITSSIGKIFGTNLGAGAMDVLGSTGMGLATQSTGLGALGGIGGLAGLAMPLVGLMIPMLSKLFSKKGGPKQGGEAWFGNKVFDAWTPDSADADVKKAMGGFADTLAATFANLGLKSLEGLSANLGFDTDPKGTAGTRVSSGLFLGGKEVYGQLADIGREGDVGAEMGVQMQRLILAAVRESDLTEEMRKVFDGVDIAGASESDIAKINAQLTAIKAIKDAFAGFAEIMPQVADLSYDAQEAIATLSGGIGALSANMQTYYQNFYSEAERHAIATQQMTDALSELGYTLPATKEEFRNLVEAQDLTTEAGRRNYATLLQLSGAFAQLDSYANQASDSVNSASDALAKAAAIANERYSLETQLLTLQGKTDELRQRELEKLDESNRPLQEQIWALEDQKKAAEEAARAAEQSARAAEESAQRQRDAMQSVHDSIESALKSLMGQSDQLAKMQRDQAKVTLQSALAIAKAGGSLVGFAGLDEALSAIQNIDSGGFASALDLARERGQAISILAELEKYTRPNGSHANGISSVPFDGYMARLHKGERVQTADEAAGADAQTEEVRNLRNDMRAMMIPMVENTERIRKRLDRWDGDGLPETRAVV